MFIKQLIHLYAINYFSITVCPGVFFLTFNIIGFFNILISSFIIMINSYDILWYIFYIYPCNYTLINIHNELTSSDSVLWAVVVDITVSALSRGNTASIAHHLIDMFVGSWARDRSFSERHYVCTHTSSARTRESANYITHMPGSTCLLS